MRLATRSARPWRRARTLKLFASCLVVAMAGTLLVALPALGSPAGSAYAWGRNDDGQVGNGSTSVSVATPTPVNASGDGNLHGIQKMEGGYFHTLGLHYNGLLQAWGRNQEAQLGIGTQSATDQLTPVTVSGLLSKMIVDVSAAGFSSMALDSDGGVWVWGVDVRDQTTKLSPVQVPLPVAATAVSAGVNHQLALGSNGKVYAWGLQQYGQVGDGSTPDPDGGNRKATPVELSLTNVVAIQAGQFHSLALREPSAGVREVYGWGLNNGGQLGDGTTTDRSSPVFVATGTFQQLSSHDNHALTLDASGTVRFWGNAGAGGSATVPTIVTDSDLVDVKQVVAASGASFAVRNDGTIVTWGSDTGDQLGRGAGETNEPTPVVMPFPSPAEAVFAGHFTQYAIARGPVISISPNVLQFGNVAVGGNKTLTSTLTNAGSGSLSILDISMDLTGFPADYSMSENCTSASPFAPGASCQVTVTFAPNFEQPYGGQISVSSNATNGNTLLIGLSGTGIAAPAGISGFEVSVNEGDVTTPTGVKELPIGDVPPTLIPETVPGTQDAPLAKTPLAKTPLAKTPLAKTPLAKTPLAKTPLAKTPLAKTPLAKTPLAKTPLAKTVLSQYPMLRAGGWSEILRLYTTNYQESPPSSVTWEQAFNDSAADGPFKNPAHPDALRLEEINWAFSPLAQLSLVSFLLGDVKANEIIGFDECAAVQLQGQSCATDPAWPTRTFMEWELLGLQLELTSLITHHLGDIADKSKALFFELGIIDTDIRGTSFANISLDDPALAATLSQVVDCSAAGGCAGKTLGEVAPTETTAGFIRDTATFSLLGTTIDGISLAETIMIFVDRSALDWESLPPGSIPVAAIGENGNYVELSTSFTAPCSQISGETGQLAFKLVAPAGFRYRPGSTALADIEGAYDPGDPTDNGAGDLVWDLTDEVFCGEGDLTDSFDMSFQLLAPLNVGNYEFDAKVNAGALTSTLLDQAAVQVVSGFEPNDTIGAPAGADVLLVGQIDSPTDKDFFSFTVAPGKIVEVDVSNFAPLDLDAVLYYPVGAQESELLTQNSVDVPFGEAPLAEPGFAAELTAPPEVAGDVHIEPGRYVGAVSAFRGGDPEQASVIAKSGTDGSQTHTLQVTGYNGSHGPTPYVVRITISDPVPLPACPGAFTFPNAMGAAAAALPTFNGDENTIVVTNKQRLEAAWGTTAAADIIAKLDQLVHPAAGISVNGEVFFTDAVAGIGTAHTTADGAGGNRCNPALRNDIVRLINDQLRTMKAGLPLQNIVIVGDDDIVPHARLLDETRDGNEREYTGDVLFDGNNALAGSLGAGYFLSDDPYANFLALTLFGKPTYLPQYAIGRLAETPTDIIASVDQFLTFKGKADPRTSSTDPLAVPVTDRKGLETDYDFLTDGGQQVFDALEGQMGNGNVARLTGPSWTRQNLEDAWINQVEPPHVAAINAHFDHYRALPSAGNTSGSIADLFTTAAVNALAANKLSRRIVFSMGCHSAFNAPNRLGTAVDPARMLDWPEIYARKGTAVLVGNLGFGYGDQATVAFTEKLMAQFADYLDDTDSVGQSLRKAKVGYYLQMASFAPYDVKTIQQTIMWGLPMYQVPGPAVAASAAMTTAASIKDDPITGLKSTTVPLAPAFSTNTLGDGTSFLEADDGTQATSGYPIMPKVVEELPAGAGLRAVGAIPVAATVDSDPINIAFADATIDSSIEEAAVTDGVNFPTSLQNINTFVGAGGTHEQSLVVIPAQYSSDADPVTPPGVGTILKYLSSEWIVYYQPTAADDAVQPTIAQVGAVHAGGNTAFSVDVTHPGGPAKRVIALGFTAGGTTAKLVELSRNGSTNTWTGGTLGEIVSFDVYAVGPNGTVASHTRKGGHHAPEEVPPAPTLPAGVTVTVNDQPPTADWYTVNANVEINGDTTGDLKLEVDGGAPQASPALIGSDGFHTVQIVHDTDGPIDGGFIVLVDKTAPKIVIETPGNGSVFELNAAVTESYRVIDGGSGVDTLSVTDSTPGSNLVNTMSLGAKTFTVTATDIAGNSSTANCGAAPPAGCSNYTVTYGDGVTAFLPPVDAHPTYRNGKLVVNSATTQQTIPFKWKIVDANGVPWPNADLSKTTYSWKAQLSAVCSGTGTLLEPIDADFISLPTSSPVYNVVGQFYQWNIKKGGLTGCFLFTLKLDDGSQHKALFSFK